MKKNNTCSDELAPVSHNDKCRMVYPNAVIKCTYDPQTGIVYDDRGDQIGTGVFKDGVLTVTQTKS